MNIMGMLYEMNEEEERGSEEAFMAPPKAASERGELIDVVPYRPAAKSGMKRRTTAESLRRARNICLNVKTIEGPDWRAFEDGLSRVRVLLLGLAEMAEKAEPPRPETEAGA